MVEITREIRLRYAKDVLNAEVWGSIVARVAAELAAQSMAVRGRVNSVHAAEAAREVADEVLLGMIVGLPDESAALQNYARHLKEQS